MERDVEVSREMWRYGERCGGIEREQDIEHQGDMNFNNGERRGMVQRNKGVRKKRGG